MAVPPEADNRAHLTSTRVTEFESPFDGSPRGRLLTAIGTVVTHGGYRDATIERVLGQAGVGWPDFAREFHDLDDCFLAALDAGIGCAIERMERAMGAAASSDQSDAAFDIGLTELLEAIAESPELARLCLVESAALGAKAVERKEAGLQRLVRLIQTRPGSPPAASSLPKLAAEMVVGGIYEVVQRKVRAGQIEDLPSLADELRLLWLPVMRSATG